MRIDNSAQKLFWFCPEAYRVRYEENLELIGRSREGLDFGTRFHELQNARYVPDTQQTPLADPRLEAECQATFQAHLQHYATDNFDVVDVERTLVVPLTSNRCPRCQDDGIVKAFESPGSHYCAHCDNPYVNPNRHELAFKMDLVFREAGGLAILDYKTEKPPGIYNSAEAWAARSQVSLYQWAAARHYSQRISAIYLDVTTRGSAKATPTFNRQRLVRTSAQQETAAANIIWVADQIEASRASSFWPQNTEHCRDGWRRCDNFTLCHIGRTDGNLKLYQIAQPYLDL